MPGYKLTDHAKQMINERHIAVEWVEQVLKHPVKIERDRNDPTIHHALGRIQEYGDRVLRVVYDDSRKPSRVITVYFDRKMKGRL